MGQDLIELVWRTGTRGIEMVVIRVIWRGHASVVLARLVQGRDRFGWGKSAHGAGLGGVGTDATDGRTAPGHTGRGEVRRGEARWRAGSERGLPREKGGRTGLGGLVKRRIQSG